MSYIPIISPPDLSTHIYSEIMDEIVRDNDGTTSEAILTGIEEAKLYLSRYDLVQLFGDAGPLDVSATFSNSILTSLVKDLVCWHLIKLGNPSLEYEHYLNIYDRAITKLKQISSGALDPKWPYLNTVGETAPKGNAVFSNSMDKRRNTF